MFFGRSVDYHDTTDTSLCLAMTVCFAPIVRWLKQTCFWITNHWNSLIIFLSIPNAKNAKINKQIYMNVPIGAKCDRQTHMNLIF